jgi:2-polyprenyl-3-methyl-5-hydroxy-6-metoxy-1,4-benzoquinol methylase
MQHRCEVCAAEMRRRTDWLQACPVCGFLSSSLTAGSGTGIDGLDQLRRDNFEVLLDRLQRLRPLAGVSLLEVGCAKGWFLEAASKRGARVHGIEPEDANVAIARASGLTVEAGFFPADLRDRGPYDMIVFNDVFEHLPEPAVAIGDVAALLAPGGLALLNLPSSNGTFYRLARLLSVLGIHGPFERLWQKGFPSPHVSYFNPANLAALVERYSDLGAVDRFALGTVSRAGLRERIASSHKGVAGHVMFAAIWPLSFVLPLLPADIQVGVFRKDG